MLKKSQARDRSTVNTANDHNQGKIFSSFSYNGIIIIILYKIMNFFNCTFLKATDNMIDVTKMISPARKVNNANITRIFRTERGKTLNLETLDESN